MNFKNSIALLICLPIFLSEPLFAQTDENQHPLLSDAFSIGLGAFIHDKSIDIRADGSTNLPGEDVDFDENWGLSDSKSSMSAVLRWRFGEKWSLWGQYFDSSDSGNAVLEEDIEWDGATFKAGSNVGAGIDLSVARIFFGRNFSVGPRHEFGLGLGLHWLDIRSFIEGEVFVDGESTGFERKSVSAGAPMPNIGGWYHYAFSPKWLGTARLDWLDVSVGDFSGGIWNSAVGIQYQAFRHVGFDLSYQVFQLDADVDKSDWRGGVELQYKGPFLSVTANW